MTFINSIPNTYIHKVLGIERAKTESWYSLGSKSCQHVLRIAQRKA